MAPSLRSWFLLPLPAVVAGCTSLGFSQLPGPTETARLMLPHPATLTCEAVSAALQDLRLVRIDAGRSPSDEGCTVEAQRTTRWWKLGDDGERLLVRVASMAGGSEVSVSSRRAAPGQIWTRRSAEALLDRIQARADAPATSPSHDDASRGS